MTRQLDIVSEQRTAKKHDMLIRVVEFGLVGSVAHSGGVLTGFSVKIEEWECLMTIRAIKDDVPKISFVGSDSLLNCLLKAERDARNDKLVWREDKYAKA